MPTVIRLCDLLLVKLGIVISLFIFQCITTVALYGSNEIASLKTISERDALIAIFNTLPHCTLIGTLKFESPLARTKLLDQLGLAVIVRHSLEVDYLGKSKSTWIFGGLQTFIVPEGRDNLLWRPMGGDDGKFRKKNIGWDFPESWDGPCVIRKSADGEYEIKMRNGLLWSYRDGKLVKISIPDFGDLEVKCHGVFVESLTLVGQSEPEIKVEYAKVGRPLSIQMRGGQRAVLYWNDDLLNGWDTPFSGHITLSYHDGILTGMSHENAGGQLPITWKENQGWNRGDSKWPASLQLASFGNEKYATKLSEAGMEILSSLPDGKGGAVIFNPLRNTFKVRSSFGAFQFRSH